MDLGATAAREDSRFVATAARHLRSRTRGRQGELPTARAKKATPERESVVTVFTDGHRVPRTPAAIGHLGRAAGTAGRDVGNTGAAARPAGRRGHCAARIAHSFTHFRLTLKPVLCRVRAPSGDQERLCARSSRNAAANGCR